MPLTPGTRLGSYEILSLIGAGGMGEVYRAQDSRLKRAVAVKIVPEAMSGEPERIFRFEREAELLASLNHPNIATVHDFEEADGRRFLVMELVEGETLAERLKRGPLPIDAALEIAKQITEALEAAHQKGIIHRDLKPANIKILPDGKVKVLDFGLAKIYENETSSLDNSNSPTLLSSIGNGIILGTAAYMSPEQARGNPVDKRTDIWALGCVIYEMLSGKQAFAGDNVSDTIASVLREEPQWGALPSTTPRRIRLMLERCLQKDSRRRLRDAGDAQIEIDDAGSDEAEAPTARRRVTPVAMILALLVGAVLAPALWWIFRGLSAETRSPLHLSFALPYPTASILDINAGHRIAISPDGKKI